MTPEPNDRTPLDFTRALELVDGTEVRITMAILREDIERVWCTLDRFRFGFINCYGRDIRDPTGPQIVRNRVEEWATDLAEHLGHEAATIAPNRHSDGAQPDRFADLRRVVDLVQVGTLTVDVASLKALLSPPTPPSPQPMSDERVERVARAEAWLRAISDWLLSTDSDMKLPIGVLDTDPLDIADELAAIAAMDTPPQDEVAGELLRQGFCNGSITKDTGYQAATRIQSDAATIAGLAERIAVLEGALRDCADPLGYLRRMAEAEGNSLSGMAYSIANDPETIKGIARAALNKDADNAPDAPTA